MRNLEISHDDYHTILNALRLATETWEGHARELSERIAAGQLSESSRSLVSQFERQAENAERAAINLIGAE